MKRNFRQRSKKTYEIQRYSQRKEKQLAKINNEQKEKDDELQRLREELERMKQDKGSDDNKEEKPSEEQK